MLAIFIITSIIYSNTFNVPFVFDDLRQIEEKEAIRDLRNYFSPKILLSHRPLGDLTFALNYEFGKLHVFGYHLVNLIIHVLNGFLVYFLTLTILMQVKDRPVTPNPRPNEQTLPTCNYLSTANEDPTAIRFAALFAALIFVVHPLQTQAVTYTIQRYTSLAGMFYIACILLYIKARASSNNRTSNDQVSGIPSIFKFRFGSLIYFVLSFICAVLSFLSKENAASIPGAILLVELLLLDKRWGSWKIRGISLFLVFILFGVLILYLVGITQGEIDFGRLLEDVSSYTKETGKVSRWQYLCTQVNVITIYIRLLFCPFGQNLDYMYPFKSGFFDGFTPWAFLILISILVIAGWNLKRRPALAFGIFYFFITLSVESSIIPIRDALFEHRLYLPMFGFALVLSYVLFFVLPLNQWWRMGIVGILIIGLGSAAFNRNQVYRDRVTLWTDVVTKSPKNYRGHFNLGNAFRDQGDLKKAIESYSRALQIHPNFTMAEDNLGVVLIQEGRLEEAVRLLSQALKTRPRDATLDCNLGIAFMRQGKLEDAIHHLNRAIERKPEYVEAHNNLGIVFAQQGNMEKAVDHFSKALESQPNNPETHMNLGLATMLQGNKKESLRHFSRVIEILPHSPDAHYQMAMALMRFEDYGGAIHAFSQALKLKPGFKAAREGLGRAMRLKKMRPSW